MLKIGLTGGIGSGKSTVAKVFELLNIPIYYADIEAKKILDNNSGVKKQIIENFGNLYVNKKINRPKLANIVFNDKQALATLNQIVHPKIEIHYTNWCNARLIYKYTIKEAAILFESDKYLEMDKIITVIAPLSVRVQRVCKRDNISSQKVTERINNQWTDEQRVYLSDFIIKNDDKNLVIPQILKINNLITRKLDISLE